MKIKPKTVDMLEILPWVERRYTEGRPVVTDYRVTFSNQSLRILMQNANRNSHGKVL